MLHFWHPACNPLFNIIEDFKPTFKRDTSHDSHRAIALLFVPQAGRGSKATGQCCFHVLWSGAIRVWRNLPERLWPQRARNSNDLCIHGHMELAFRGNVQVSILKTCSKMCMTMDGSSIASRRTCGVTTWHCWIKKPRPYISHCKSQGVIHHISTNMALNAHLSLNIWTDTSNKNNRPLAIVGFLRLPGMALHEAACHGDLCEVKRLLEGKRRVDIVNDLNDISPFYGQTPLGLATQYGHIAVVELLLERKAPIEGPLCSPLCLAAEKGHRDIVQLLLERTALREARDAENRTPLFWATMFGDMDLVQLLLEEKAEIFAVDFYGETPLSCADRRGNNELVEAFLDHFAKQGACSCSQICSIMKLQNQELAVKALDRWPQETKMAASEELGLDGLARGTESLRRAQLRERVRTVLGVPKFSLPEVNPDVEMSKPLRSRGPSSVRVPLIVSNDLQLELCEQNLFWASEVAVTLKVLHGVVGSDAVNEDFLQTLSDTPHDAIFETDAVQAMILAAWEQERAFTWLEIGSCIFTVMTLCLSSYGFRQGELALAKTSLWLVAVLHTKKTLDEFIQFFQHSLVHWICRICFCRKSRRRLTASYVSFDNMADIWYIVTGWVAIYRQFFVFPSSLEKPWMAMFCAFSWLRLLYCLRGEAWMGKRLLPILSAIKDTVAFFVLMCICLAAAAHAYYNLGVRDEPTPTYAAFMQVIRLGVFGDFDMFEFEGLDPTYTLNNDDNIQIWEPQDPEPGPDYVWVHALFYSIGMGITVLLMNVLIGVLGANYERFEDQAVGQFFRARLKMLVELRGRPIRNLATFRGGGLPGWISLGVRVLCNIVILVCSPCFLVLILVSCIFFSPGAVQYALRSAFGQYGLGYRHSASECAIFFVVRQEPDINDVRSLRTDLKQRIESLDGKIEALEKTMGEHFSEMRALIAGQTQPTKKKNPTQDQIEFIRSQSEPVSPQEVELDSFSHSSHEVSHIQRTEGVRTGAPKVKKKGKKVVKRLTKTSAAASWQPSWTQKTGLPQALVAEMLWNDISYFSLLYSVHN